jgi:hypothetical protein
MHLDRMSKDTSHLTVPEKPLVALRVVFLQTGLELTRLEEVAALFAVR